MRAPPLILFALLAACSDLSVFIPRLWPSDHFTVVIVTDEGGFPLEREPRLFAPDMPARFGIETTGSFKLAVYTYSGDSDLQRCGVAFGGEGELLSRAETAWVSELVAGEEDRLELRASAETQPGFDLRKARCLPPVNRGVCEMISAVSYRPPSLSNTYAWRIAMISRDHWFLEGEDLQQLVRFVATLETTGETETSSRAALPPIASDNVGFVYDPDSALLFTAWESGEIFQLDLQKRIVARLNIPAFRPSGIARSGPGTVLVFGDAGVYEWTARSSIAVAAGDNYPPGLTSLILGEGDKKAAIAGRKIWELRDDTWREAIGGDNIVEDDEEEPLAANDRVITFAGEQDVRLRPQNSDAWVGLPHPFVSGGSHAGTPIGNGVLVVGFGGRASLWNKDVWCPIMTGGLSALRDVVATPDGTVAVAAGAGTPTSDGPLITRFQIPLVP